MSSKKIHFLSKNTCTGSASACTGSASEKIIDISSQTYFMSYMAVNKKQEVVEITLKDIYDEMKSNHKEVNDKIEARTS